MSRKYTDAEKAAYYKKLASQKKSSYKPRKTYSKPSSSASYKYRYKSNKAATKERTRRIEARKEPGYISAAGSMLGNLVHPAAGFLGGKIGHLIEQITGFGDYKVASNTVLTGGMSPAQVVNSVERGGVILRHREYIGDIKATQAFTIQSFLLQPGLPDTFPWLSQIANSYEQYRLRGALFEFKSTSSDALLSSSTSTALGTVAMSTDYDVADNPPTSLKQMLNYEYSCANKPSVSFIHPIECKKSLTPQTMLYTRGIAVPAGYDQRLYDLGRFNIATEGMQADGGVLGQLWITYEVELFKQQFNFTGLADKFSLKGVTALLPLGDGTSSPSVDNGGTMGGEIDAAGGRYLFPPDYSEGLYFVCYTVVGGGGITVGPGGMTGYNCSDVQILVNNTLNRIYIPSPDASNTTICMIGYFQITGQNAGIIFTTTSTMPGATRYGDLLVTRLPTTMIPT